MEAGLTVVCTYIYLVFYLKIYVPHLLVKMMGICCAALVRCFFLFSPKRINYLMEGVLLLIQVAQ